MWSPFSIILTNSLNCFFVMPVFWDRLAQLIMAWTEWNWFMMSTKRKYDP